MKGWYEMVAYLNANRNVEGLKELARTLEVEFSQPDLIHSILWLSPGHVVKQVCKALPTLLQYLEDRSKDDEVANVCFPL